VSFLHHSPEFDLPEYCEPCPHDAVSLIEEWHMGLHKILISKRDRKRSYKPVATIICQDGGDKRSRPAQNPDEIAEYVMSIIQWEIDKSDDPGMYRMSLVGPPGKGRFERSKHIDMSHDDGAARTMNFVNEGELHEMKDAYIGELHGHILAMIEMVTASHRAVVNENREMTKIVSEAVRKNGELEQNRLMHQLKVREMEDDARFRDAEAERKASQISEGIGVFKDSGAIDEILKAVARKIDEFGGPKETSLAVIEDDDPEDELDDDEVEADEPVKKKDSKKKASKKKASKKKSAKKKSKRKSTKKKSSKKKATIRRASADQDEEDDPDEEVMAEGRRMVQERPLVMAAEALKMSIDVNGQWSIIRKTLTEEQADILDEIIASKTDEEVVENAQALYAAPGNMRLMELSNHLDEQQQKFIGFILSHIKK
jgi:hypothetical protein